jgi:hypothetical protein
MKKLIYTVLMFSMMWGVDSSPTAGSGAADSTLVKLYDVASEAIADAEADNYKRENVGTAKEAPTFFQELTDETCTDIQAYKCPALKTNVTDKVVMLDFVNVISGKIQCSVYNTSDDVFNSDIPFYTKVAEQKTFNLKSCVEEFALESNLDSSQEIMDARDLLLQQEEELKNIEVTNAQGAETANKKFLDLGDWLDALSTFDNEKIDIDKTLKQWEVSTTADYTIYDNSLNIESIRTNMLKILRYYSVNTISEDKINAKIESAVKYSNDSQLVSNSQYVMYLDFFSRSNEYINDIMEMIVGWFVLYNLLTQIGLNALANKISGNQNQENYAGRTIFAIGMFTMFFASSTQIVNIQNDIEGNDISQVRIEQQKIQGILRWVYGQANEYSDGIAKIAITSYLNGLKLTSGFGSVDQLMSYAAERKSVEKSLDYYADLDRKCGDAYDVMDVKVRLENFRKTVNMDATTKVADDTTNFKSGVNTVWSTVTGNDWYTKDFNYLNINPYPTSEYEAFAMMKAGDTGKNPYSAKKDGGLVTDGFIESNPTHFLSLSGCFANKKDFINAKNRLNDLDEKIEKIKDTNGDEFAKKKEMLETVYGMVWKNYQQLGYISVAFLPATHALIQEQELLGDAQKQEELKKALSGDESAIESVMKYIATAMPMLTFFGGMQIAELFNNVLSSIPYASYVLSGDVPGVLHYILAYASVETIFQALVTTVLIGSALIAFIVLAIQKLWTFFSVIFLSIYMASDNQQQKVAAALGKMIATAFKTVLLVVSTFIAIYTMSLLDSMQTLLTTSFYSDMVTINGFEENGIFDLVNYVINAVQQYSFYGVSQVTFMVLKIYVILVCLFKLPNYFYDLIEVNVNDVGNQILDSVQQHHENHTMKGV